MRHYIYLTTYLVFHIQTWKMANMYLYTTIYLTYSRRKPILHIQIHRKLNIKMYFCLVGVRLYRRHRRRRRPYFVCICSQCTRYTVHGIGDSDAYINTSRYCIGIENFYLGCWVVTNRGPKCTYTRKLANHKRWTFANWLLECDDQCAGFRIIYVYTTHIQEILWEKANIHIIYL